MNYAEDGLSDLLTHSIFFFKLDSPLNEFILMRFQGTHLGQRTPVYEFTFLRLVTNVLLI